MSLKRKRSLAAHVDVDVGDQFDPDVEPEAQAEFDDPDRKPPSKRQNAPRQLFVRSLPADATTESLAEHFSQSFPVKHANVVVDPATKKSKGYGFVTFADAEDAQQARVEFDGSIFDGKRIKIDVAAPRHRNTTDDARTSQPSAGFLKAKAERLQQKEAPPPRLIVRNLPWSIKEPDQLARLFMSYGKIKSVTLPQTKPGRSPGFGFVLLRGKKNAEKAMAGVNGRAIDGRTLAVDWAVQKDVWQASQTNQQSSGLGEQGDDASVKSEDEVGVKLDGIPPSDAEMEEFLSEDDEDQGTDEDIDIDDEVKTEDDMDEDDLANAQEDKSTTLFVRNLPFTTRDDTLYEHFKAFGPLRYARVVMDHETDRSRGTGFVCFHKLEDVKECLRKSPKINGPSGARANSSVKYSLLEDTQADKSGLFTIEGRVVQVSLAVNKNEAQRLTTEGQSLREARDKDKRRLYLLSEGTINSNSPMYSNLSPSELKMREDSAKQRQTLIRGNPSLHLSLTRLSVRNIPRFVTSKDLKAFAREAVVGFAKDVKEGRRSQLSAEELSRGGEEMKEVERQRKAKGKGIVKQAKIVFEGKEGGKIQESTGAGRSRGYGFIEFSSHRWALMGLRWLNGHRVQRTTEQSQSVGSEDRPKRLIVEFSIENAQVVARRKDREAKARERSRAALEARQMDNGKTGPQKKVLTKDQTMKKMRLGSKKEQVQHHRAQDDSEESGDEASVAKGKGDKAAKRQQIIGRKRALRKARKA